MLKELFGKKRLVLWGTGNIARQFTRAHQLDWSFAVDTYTKRGTFEQLQIYSPEIIGGQDILVIVCVQEHGEIFDVLESYGKYRNVDYIDYDTADLLINRGDRAELLSYLQGYRKGETDKRKKAVIFGNCLGDILRAMLIQSPDFNRDYYIEYLPPNYLFPTIGQQKVPDEILWDCELFIYQKTDGRYGNLLSSKNIEVPGHAQRISIPTFHFPLYFPQISTERKVDNENRFQRVPWLDFNDSWLDACHQNGIRTAEGIKAYISEASSLINFEADREIMLKRMVTSKKEIDCNVVDFILEQYQERPIFTDPWHIHRDGLQLLANRLLGQLGYPPVNMACNHAEGFWTLIHPLVASYFYSEKICRILLTEKIYNWSDGHAFHGERYDYYGYIEKYLSYLDGINRGELQ